MECHKIGEQISVVYQAANAETGLTPVMEIFDETRAKDVPNFPDVNMIEVVNAPGRYVGTFTPDQPGEWMIIMNDGTGKGKAVVSFSIGGWNIHSIGAAMAQDATVAKDATVSKANKLQEVKDVVDQIATDVNNIETSTPPMVA